MPGQHERSRVEDCLGGAAPGSRQEALSQAGAGPGRARQGQGWSSGWFMGPGAYSKQKAGGPLSREEDVLPAGPFQHEYGAGWAERAGQAGASACPVPRRGFSRMPEQEGAGSPPRQLPRDCKQPSIALLWGPGAASS